MFFNAAVFSGNPASVSYVDNSVAKLQLQLDQDPDVRVGKSYPGGGGKVFYIDNKLRRGLIAYSGSALSEQWCETSVTNEHIETCSELFCGKQNTNNMLANVACSSPLAIAVTSIAAPKCQPPLKNCSGWYIPSTAEIFTLIATKDIINLNTEVLYWTSNEATDFEDEFQNRAVLLLYMGSIVTATMDKYMSAAAQPIRSFAY